MPYLTMFVFSKLWAHFAYPFNIKISISGTHVNGDHLYCKKRFLTIPFLPQLAYVIGYQSWEKKKKAVNLFYDNPDIIDKLKNRPRSSG